MGIALCVTPCSVPSAKAGSGSLARWTSASHFRRNKLRGNGRHRLFSRERKGVLSKSSKYGDSSLRCATLRMTTGSLFQQSLKYQLGGKINGASASGALHQTEIGIADAGIRVAEIRRIRGAEPLRPEFHIEPFRQLHPTEERGIKLEKVGAGKHVATDIAKCRLSKKHGRIRENRGVKPGLRINPLQLFKRSADPGRLSIAGSIKRLAIAAEVERPAGHELPDTAQFPSAENSAGQARLEEMLPLAHRQLPDEALVQNVRAIKVRAGVITPEVNVIRVTTGILSVLLLVAQRLSVCVRRGHREAAREAAIKLYLERIVI